MSTVLKQTRESKGFTQVQVADKAKISERVYQRYEAGECLPNVLTAQLIAVALGATVGELFPVCHQPLPTVGGISKTTT